MATIDKVHEPTNSPGQSAAHQRRRKKRATLLLLMPGLGWIAVFVLGPLAFTFAMSFWKSTIFGTIPDFQFGNYWNIVATPLYSGLLFKTLRIALATTLISLTVSYPIAYFLSIQTPFRKIILALLLFLPFWTSYVVRTFVWLPILGNSGAINEFLLWLGAIHKPIEWLLYDEGSVYIGLVYVYTLFMTLPIFLSIEKIDPALIEAASDLGAKTGWIFLRVILPLSWPGVLSGSIMVFLLSMSAYVTPQLLGGTSGIMFSNMIAAQFLSNNNWAQGAALSVTLSAIVLMLLAAAGRWIGVQQVFTGGRN